MDECFKCGVSGDRALLFSAISEKGIVKICRKCSFEEDIPIMKYIEEKVEKRQTVHERLFRLSGIEMKNEEDKINIQISNEAKDESLMKIANENFKKQVLAPLAYPEKSSTKIFTKGNKNPFGMIDNFHWVIMRARRAKKLNQKQFAEAIEESEKAIKMAEEGILPKNDFVLVNKIENYLGIVLREEFARAKSFDKEVEIVKEEFVQNVKEDNVKFDDTTTKTLTIADLQEMKQKREEAPSHGDDLRRKRPHAYNHKGCENTASQRRGENTASLRSRHTKENGTRIPPRQEGSRHKTCYTGKTSSRRQGQIGAGQGASSSSSPSINKDVNTKGKKIDLDSEDISQEDIDRILFGK